MEHVVRDSGGTLKKSTFAAEGTALPPKVPRQVKDKGIGKKTTKAKVGAKKK